ncbi:MAG: aldehyde dehydrogenase family protein [Myxococcales bacterium]
MTTIEVRNPRNGELLRSLPETPAAEVAEAVERARRAQRAWGELPFEQRADALRRLVRRLRDDARVLELLVAESGKPRYEAELFELLYTLELTRFYTSREARDALADDVRGSRLFPNKRARVVYHPRGVVGVIGPWNWPLLNNFADAVAPLLAGNAVILKPSEWTPLTSLRIAELWNEEGLPADVLQVMVGRAEVGQALVDRCDMIFFTGSQRAGRQIAVRCAERLIPCVLELGGKSSMIVLRDADLPRAARAAVWSGFAHSGQVCIRTERVFVEEPVADAFIELCRREAERLRHGPGRAPDDIDVGAMTFPPQLSHLERLVADATQRGAHVLLGGRRGPGPGNYFEPTIVTDATASMAVMNEETFGPVLPIMRVRSAEEAVRLTNESSLGLSGSVWSQDTDKANALARCIESGSVCVNDVLFNYLCVEAPLGGIKGSGLGLRHGVEGLRQFCRLETVVEDRPALRGVSGVVSGLLSFPYDSRMISAARAMMKIWL